jgi:hypothetical protein
MKKILAMVLVCVLLLSAVGCNTEEPPAHVHEFVLSETDSKAATCLEDGIEVKICSCGERQEQPLAALGHDMRVTMDVKPSCTKTGSIDSMCFNCGKKEYKNVEALGHSYEETPSEPSRVIRCLNEGCTSCMWGKSNNKHQEALTFHFTKEDEAAIDAKYDEVLALLNAAEKYNASKHGYAEEGALADAFKAVDAVHTELYELIENAISQRQLAEIAYYCDMDNSELEETYSYMLDYYTAVIAKFYTLSRPFYDSCYREFYYEGMTEEEIKAFLFDSDAISNPEYTALKDRNNAIEVEVLALTNPQKGDELPKLYAEFVENNNKMAKLMGYDNYLEYAYENVYSRDYTYQDVAQFSDYVKTHLSSVFAAIYKKWDTLAGYTQEDINQYYTQVQYPFFET